LEISLQITIFLPKKYSLIGSITLLIFFAETKKTIEQYNSDKIFKSLLISPFFSGKKP